VCGLSDPFFNNVVLLCHFDGANTSTTIIDSSAAAHSLTATGTIFLLTSIAMFGTASLSQTGAGSYVATPDSADWDFGNGQFTIEAWVRPTSALTGIRAIVSQFGGTTDLGWFFGWNGTTLSFYYSTTGTDNPVIGGTYPGAINQWMHVAVDRDASNVLRVYANGAVVASATVAATFFNSTRSLRVLNDEGAVRGMIGQMDDLRITKGVARYAGAYFIPQEAFPDAFGPAPGIKLSGAVREVLLTSNANLNVAGVIREVLMSSAGTAVAVLEQQTAVSVIT
jgi:hypothetical protein